MSSEIEVLNNDELVAQAEQQIEDLLANSLPLSRVKKICRLDPEVVMCNQEAVRMITKATEIFIGELSKACYTQAIIDKRKTVQPKDLDKVIKSNWLFEFLEDALDGWPDQGGRVNAARTVAELEETTEAEDELPDTVAITEGRDQSIMEDIPVDDVIIGDDVDE